LSGQLDQIGGELFLVVSAPRGFALCRAMLTECGTGAPLGDRQRLPDVREARPAPRGA